jgi:hypothetical protein
MMRLSGLWFTVIALSVLLMMPVQNGLAQRQDRSYELLPAPDLWYNDVDGIRVGLRLRGQVPGSFNDGPHRLDFGIWLGTWFPNWPVSYYLQYTEPIGAISDFNSEGSVSAISSIRTGFHRHALRFDKRWQEGFNEDVFREFHAETGVHRRFSMEYVPYPAAWQEKWVQYLGTAYEVQREMAEGQGLTNVRISVLAGLTDAKPIGGSEIREADQFGRISVELNNRYEISRGFRAGVRATGTLSGASIPLEYGLIRGTATPVDWMNSGFTRAKGTIPVSWLNAGTIGFSGGPSLRGYVYEDIRSMKSGLPMLFRNFFSVNAELDYPNPVDRMFSNIPIAGDFLSLRSYLFYDGGAGLTLGREIGGADFGSLPPGHELWTTLPAMTIESEASPYFSNLGAGFMLSLNIPDYLGKPRGFVIRYEIPFWLSHPPAGQERLRFRGLLGLGGIIAL